MDDAVVEDEFDNLQNTEEIRNKDPLLLTSSVSSIGTFLQTYGWYLLFVVVILCYIYNKYKAKLQNFLGRKRSDVTAHRYDNEEIQRKHEAMEEARRRLQERYSMDAVRHKEEEEAKEEDKRRDRIADWERHKEGRGYRSKTKFRDGSSSEPSSSITGQSKKRIYRTDDYNPLTGSSGGSSYRPPPRRGGGGGG